MTISKILSRRQESRLVYITSAAINLLDNFNNLIINSDNNDGIKFVVAFRYPSSLGPKNKNIQVSLTLN